MATSLPEFKVGRQGLPSWAHVEVEYWYDEWQIIRDCVGGEREIKDKSVTYLPKLDSMDSDLYAAYISRATFHNFTGRTVEALTGTLMARRPVVTNLPAKLKEELKKFTRTRKPFHMFATAVARETVQMGRIGILVDMPSVETTQPRPYATSYTAENILDWEEGEVNGEIQLTRVVLRESRKFEKKISGGMGIATTQISYVPRYRELLLERLPDGKYAYYQKIYEDVEDAIDFELDDKHLVGTVWPLRRGEYLDFIPFAVIGPKENSLDCEKPPMIDIARLNLSHYQSYAWLEHGRFFTGFPIYYVESPAAGGGEEANFTIGSSNVWVTPPGAKPGLLEMNGQGLKFLSDALDEKEQQAASIGGRMMGIRTQAVAESDNQLKIGERNEQSVLFQIAMALDVQMTKVVQWWAYMAGTSKKESETIGIEFDKDFMFADIGAREFRAIHAMYKDGVLPIEVIYAYFKKSNVIPDWMTEDEFKSLLSRTNSFPNNPDVEARQSGFPDKQAELNQEAADKALKSAEKIAASAPAPAPAPGTPPGNQPPR